MSMSVVARVIIDADISTVWSVFTDISNWEKWYGVPVLAADWRAGGSVTYGGQYGSTEAISDFTEGKSVTIAGRWADDVYSFREEDGKTIAEKEIVPKNGASFREDGILREEKKQEGFLAELGKLAEQAKSPAQETKPIKGKKVCAACGAEAEEDYKFCLACGTPLAQEKTVAEEPAPAPLEAKTSFIVCPACGEKSEPCFKFCMQCGARLDAPAPEPEKAGETIPVIPSAEAAEEQPEPGCTEQEADEEAPYAAPAACPVCGEPSTPYFKFCMKCGASFDAPVNKTATEPATEPVMAEEPAASEDTDDMLCKACGEPVKPGYKFCMKCGARIDEQKEETVFEAEVIESEIPEPEQEEEATEEILIEEKAEPEAIETVVTEESAAEEPAVILCRVCGAIADPGQKFCMKCGARIDEQKEETVFEAEVIESEIPEPEQTEAAAEVLIEETAEAPALEEDKAENPGGAYVFAEAVEAAAAPVVPETPAAPEQPVIKCLNCGAPLDPYNKYCTVCGISADGLSMAPEFIKRNKKLCQNCGAEITGAYKFCIKCGFPVPAEQPEPPKRACKFCSGCGEQVDPEDRFCLKCGRKLKDRLDF